MVFISKFNSGFIICSGSSIFNISFNNSTQVAIPAPNLRFNITDNERNIILSKNPVVVALAVARDDKYVAFALENKQVFICDAEFITTKNFVVPRVPIKICFSPANDLIVADKTGDVYLYKADEECGVLLLGHLSMILDMTFSDCGQYLITCDRDEKVRVSHYPNSYNIVSFCLGHTEFVTSVKVCGTILVSASGDGTLRYWDCCSGKQLALIDTNENLQNKQLLESFSKEMDNEKVEVTSLPVTKLEIYSANDVLYSAVSLLNNSNIQLYSFNLKTKETNYIRSINCGFPHTFLFDKNILILNQENFLCYDLKLEDFIQVDDYLLNFYNKQKCDLDFINYNQITMFYKRKFDNVMEYMEKKKSRLKVK